MFAKWFLGVAAVVALAFLALGAEPCRADEFEDQQFQQVRQGRQAEALALKRAAADALAKSQVLARSAPAEASKLLRASLARLRADDQLPRAERRGLISRLEGCLREVNDRIAAAKGYEEGGQGKRPHQGKGPAAAASQRRPVGQGKPQGGGAPLGGATVQLDTTVVVPDGGTAVAGGYRQVVEGRNEFGPPGLSNLPYASRLFRNVGYGRDVRSYRVRIGVRIISLREEEERFLRQAPAP